MKMRIDAFRLDLPDSIIKTPDSIQNPAKQTRQFASRSIPVFGGSIPPFFHDWSLAEFWKYENSYFTRQ